MPALCLREENNKLTALDYSMKPWACHPRSELVSGIPLHSCDLIQLTHDCQLPEEAVSRVGQGTLGWAASFKP